jgi:MFS family permease
MMAIFQSANMISLIVGPPVSGLLLRLDGAFGLYGWQWLFIVEALPPVIMAAVTWTLLTDRPADAAWLRPDQRTWLAERLASERADREAIRKYTLGEAFGNPKMLLLTATYFFQTFAGYAILFFLPLIVQGLGVSTNMIGVVSALPYVFAVVGVICWGWHSDHTGERIGHIVFSCLVCSGGMAACIVIGVGHPAMVMVALTLAITGQQSIGPVLWSLPSALLTGTAAAGGIAMINAIGNLGGFIGPWVFGLVKDATGSNNIALLCLALGPVISAITVIAAGHDPRLERMMRRS